MNSIPTYRRGRRVYHAGPKRRNFCDYWLSNLFIVFLLSIPPTILFITEGKRHQIYSAYLEVLHSNILDLNHDNVRIDRNNTLVHGTSNRIDASTLDPDMGIEIKGALVLHRNTEYCQWQELQDESCKTCTSTDEDGNTEQYDCECVKTYDYVKSWRPYLINSYFFNQPAGHHNPSRDPMPSKTFVTTNAKVEFHCQEEESQSCQQSRVDTNQISANLTPQMFSSNNVRGSHKRPIKWERNGVPPIPSFWHRWIPDRSRYEDIQDLSARSRKRKKIIRDNHDASSSFVHVGNGYFFSPYSSSMVEKVMKSFMQYLDGTLLDWQIGDLFPSCEAGDIRVNYKVQDPSIVSVLGGTTRTRTASIEDGNIIIEPYQTKNSMSVGLVHSGAQSAEAMVLAEDNASWWKSFIIRSVLIIWSVFFSRLLGVMFGRNIASAKLPQQVALAGSLWSGLIGCSWYIYWGAVFDALFFMFGSIVLLFYTILFPLPHSNDTGGPKAVWSKVEKWSNGQRSYVQQDESQKEKKSN